MKSYILIVLFNFAITFFQFVQSQTFEKLIATDFDEIAYDAIALNDSTFIILSQKGEFSTHDYPQIILYALNNYGKITDSLIIEQDSLYPIRKALEILLDSSGNLVIVGRVEHIGAFNQEARQYIAIVDNNLNLLQDTITGSADKSDIPFNFILNSKNNIVAVGSTEYDTVHNNYIAEYSVNGNLVNRIEYHWDAFASSAVTELPEDSLYFVSNIYSSSDMIMVLKTNNLSVQDTIEIEQFKLISESLLSPSSQSFLIAGDKMDNGVSKLFLSNLSYDGQIISENVYGTQDTNCFFSINSLDIGYEDELFLVGTHNFPNNPPLLSTEPRWVFANKLNSDGSIIWQRFYKGELSYMPYKVLATSDGGALILSTKYDWNHPVPNQRDIHILKVDSIGWYEGLTTGISAFDQPKQILVYPNPVIDKVNFELGYYSGLQLEIYNSVGVLVIKDYLEHSGMINLTGLPKGVYVYILSGKNGFIEKGKLIKL